ncbi:15-hydroxyprostaglandin dehydrogenase [NAD(+)]-like isoform X1 [Biomphalaria glabrata]|uniref:15-hydroxyprostaglandin dehydrogenase [NAD(+)]-like isoform X1 n=2 Tax=Biomphalaria glabrata TaxID=6526 RepID=A0A9W3AQ55_BIOGL|nr:15-hydroxyprostaglandin dehydrogenase [NAD(+)]-like isoform X1 [Biomphalaria glabrata]
MMFQATSKLGLVRALLGVYSHHSRNRCNMSCTGKVALVTGAAQGLGKAFCEILLKNGAKVGLTDVNAELGSRTAAEFESKYGKNRVVFQKCDVTSTSDFTDAFQKIKSTLGGLDIVVNNAGVGFEMGNKWELTVDINVKGTIKGTMLAMDNMRKDKGGQGGVIVNVASMAGINPNPCGPVYGATKSAIITFSQCWAKNPELLQNGVRINVLAPAFAETEMMKGLSDKSSIHAPVIVEMIKQKVGIMTPEFVAEAFYELVEDQTKTGAILKVAQTTGKQYHTM